MKKINSQSGISVLEVVITLSILSIVSVASVWLVFTTLSLRDKALATTLTQESLRVFIRQVRAGVTKANTISGDTNSLFLTSEAECWSFVYDSGAGVVRYSHVQSPGCVPESSPTVSFFPEVTKVTAFGFINAALPTGGRQVTVTGAVVTTMPFESYQSSFSDTITNVID